MESGCEQDRGERDKQKPGVKNEKPREYPGAGGAGNVFDVVLSEDEARAMKRFRPAHVIKVSRADRAAEHGHADEHERGEERTRHPAYEPPALEERLFAMFEHGPVRMTCRRAMAR